MSRVTRPAAGLPRRARSAAGSMPCATALRTSCISAPCTASSTRVEPNLAAGRGKAHLLAERLRDVARGALQRREHRAAGTSRSFAAASSACAISRSAWSSACGARRPAPRSERNCRRSRRSPRGATSSSALSARLRSAGSCDREPARGVGASGRLSAATRAAMRVHPPQQRVDLRLRRGTGPSRSGSKLLRSRARVGDLALPDHPRRALERVREAQQARRPAPARGAASRARARPARARRASSRASMRK